MRIRKGAMALLLCTTAGMSLLGAGVASAHTVVREEKWETGLSKDECYNHQRDKEHRDREAAAGADNLSCSNKTDDPNAWVLWAEWWDHQD